ncbi:MAG: hypothetical protein ABIM89_01300 [Mycobacteriales bacterium]
MPKQRTTPAGPSDARQRLRAARAYLEVAELVLDEHDKTEFTNVAAGLAVLAGIAASDALSASGLGQIHRGDDHRAAAELLRGAAHDGNKLAATFLRLIDLKSAAHYGVTVVGTNKATDALKWATTLLARAAQEVER